ncbi:hypothetical protein B2J88_40260 [Rhodococcus sp. SRB_17]|nr:hypothetical protein [Rhodococcus sp. SRB_17]
MRTFLAQHQRRILLILLVGVLVVVGSLWWTKTINFSRNMLVVFNSESMTSSQGINISDYFQPSDIQKVADTLAETRGGNRADYLANLTITALPNPPGILVAALGRTPGAAQTLANYAAQALSSMINDTALARTGETNMTSLLLEI